MDGLGYGSRLELVQVRVGEHLRHGAGEGFGLLLGDGGDVSDVDGDAAVLVDAFHGEGLVAAQLGAPAEQSGSPDAGELLVPGSPSKCHAFIRYRRKMFPRGARSFDIDVRGAA